MTCSPPPFPALHGPKTPRYNELILFHLICHKIVNISLQRNSDAVHFLEIDKKYHLCRIIAVFWKLFIWSSRLRNYDKHDILSFTLSFSTKLLKIFFSFVDDMIKKNLASRQLDFGAMKKSLRTFVCKFSVPVASRNMKNNDASANLYGMTIRPSAICV